MISEVHAGSDVQRGCFSSLKLPGFSKVLWIKGDLETVKRVSSPNQQHTQVQTKPGLCRHSWGPSHSQLPWPHALAPDPGVLFLTPRCLQLSPACPPALTVGRLLVGKSSDGASRGLGSMGPPVSCFRSLHLSSPFCERAGGWARH